MSFGENIQIYRKAKNLTQEKIAEQLDVSRQTVSKWESDTSYPEMDKIIQLCDIFGCDMDTLLRGNAAQSMVSDSAGYDRHENRFTAAICSGVELVLLGVVALLALCGAGVNEDIATMFFLVFIAVAVTVFIVSGISHGQFVKANPKIQPFYKPEKIADFQRRMPFLIALPTLLILLAVIWIIGSNTINPPSGISIEQWEYLTAAIFMFAIALAVPVYIYAGMQSAKYNIEEYNREYSLEDVPKSTLSGKLCGAIMLIATALFLLGGFIYNMWDICWVVFPVGGLACAIVSIFLGDRK